MNVDEIRRLVQSRFPDVEEAEQSKNVTSLLTTTAELGKQKITYDLAIGFKLKLVADKS